MGADRGPWCAVASTERRASAQASVSNQGPKRPARTFVGRDSLNELTKLLPGVVDGRAARCQRLRSGRDRDRGPQTERRDDASRPRNTVNGRGHSQPSRTPTRKTKATGESRDRVNPGEHTPHQPNAQKQRRHPISTVQNSLTDHPTPKCGSARVCRNPSLSKNRSTATCTKNACRDGTFRRLPATRRSRPARMRSSPHHVDSSPNSSRAGTDATPRLVPLENAMSRR